MNNLSLAEINEYVNKTIVIFHQTRINRLEDLSLNKLITKNPYLFKAKNIETASTLITGLLDAFLSSSEEKMFGDFLEGLVIFIAKHTKNGHKSGASGIDLEFVENNNHYLISIKSGPNWGNNAQHNRLVQDFNSAKKIIMQKNVNTNVISILGICYGKTKSAFQEKGYLKLVGQNFWTFISGNKNLYTEIIEPVGYRAKAHNDQFEINKSKVVNNFSKSFIDRFCFPDGGIDWTKLVEFNSGNYDLDRINI